MTLDTASYSMNGTDYTGPVVCNELFRKLLKKRYSGPLWIRYQFDVQTIPELVKLIAEKKNAKAHYFNGWEFDFTEVCEDDNSFAAADVTRFLLKGNNSYTMLMDWHQNEETYHALFGENVTESLLNCIVYDCEIENAYLTGNFGVYSRDAFVSYDEETVLGHGFYLGEMPKAVTDPVTEGFPFFRGRITLKQTFLLPSPHVVLKIAGQCQTARIRINGTDLPELVFTRKADVSSFAKEGENEIEVTFTVGNRNLLGPFHSSGPERGVTPQSFEALDLPESPDGIPFYRFCRFAV